MPRFLAFFCIFAAVLFPFPQRLNASGLSLFVFQINEGIPLRGLSIPVGGPNASLPTSQLYLGQLTSGPIKMGFLSIGALPRLLIKQMSITIPNFRAVPNWAGDFQKFIAENTILGAAAIQGLAICYPDGTTIEAETASIEAKRHRLKLTGVTVHSQGAETQKFGSGNIPLTGKSAGQLTRILEANANPSPTSQFTAEVTL